MIVHKIKEKQRQNVEHFFIKHWGSDEMVTSSGVFNCSELDGFIVFNDKDEIRGLITYIVKDRVCEIISLDSVDEGQGIGSALLKAVEYEVKRTCNKIKIITTNDNMKALGFYQKRGYRLTQIIKDAVTEARKHKPEIPLVGEYGIPLLDELELEKALVLITLLKEEDKAALYQFEVENRDYFEKMVPGRGDDYYHYETFCKSHRALLQEQAEQRSYFYLVKDGAGDIIGRVNLVDVDDDGVGGVGYRMASSVAGRGLATLAMKLLIDEAKILPNVRALEAKTTTNHIASQKVLERNGFIRMGVSEETYVNAAGEEWPFALFRRELEV
ncbi:GNAT family N-acetyltransferase [Alkalicoccobacillus gibsonii]|uniref:GNAT family N-acetyltransferase n=1 Tax=Alkalicoccobacillus gibsonii TaxID=79881 RepID=UPI003F7C92CF